MCQKYGPAKAVARATIAGALALYIGFTSHTALAATPDPLAVLLFLDQSRQMQGDLVLCLEIDGADVPQALLNTLNKTDERFVPGSACTWVLDVKKGSYHRETGKKAYFVSVSNFKELGDGSAEVQLDIRHHGKWGIYKTLEVRQDRGTWRVIRIKKHVES